MRTRAARPDRTPALPNHNLTIRFCTDPLEWDAYVGVHANATQYHRFAWLGIIERAFGHRPVAFTAFSGGRIVGVLPLVLMSSWMFGRFAVSLPFANYGGLLGDDTDVERSLWQHAVAHADGAGARYLEARHLAPRSFIGHRKQHKVTMILDLAGDPDSQWKGFNAKLRNQVRKAEKSGLTCRIAAASELSRFYDVFASCMRDLGTPVYSRRFFAEVLGALPDSSSIHLVEKDGRAVAAGIALVHRETLEVPWAASLHRFRSLCPNNLLYWDLVRHAIGLGLRKFDFGRSTPGDGPYRFKEQWGARPVPLHWEYWLRDEGRLPDLSPANERYQRVIEIWRRLPLRVTRWIGPAIVRGIP